MKSYFLHDGSAQSGPFSLEELEQKKISGDVLVWKEGMPDWLSAKNVDELTSLFKNGTTPPVFKQKPNIPNSQNNENSAVRFDETEKTPENLKKKLLIIGGLIAVLAAIGFFLFFKNKPEKLIDVPKEIALVKDSVLKKDTVKLNTAENISMDSLTSLLSVDSSSTSKKPDTINHGGFTIGGMSVQKEQSGSNEKPSSSKKSSQKEKKLAPKPEQKIKQNDAPAREEPRKQTVAIKNLIISGTFRKNLLLEAVMEGFIRNPNDQVSFHNIIVTATFLNADGEQTGSQQYHKIGILAAGGNSSFKFKGNAPKGSKSARYSVSANAID